LPFRDGKGSRAALEGAAREQGGALREHRGSKGEHYGAMQGRSRWEPKMGPLAFGLSCPRCFQYLQPRLLPRTLRELKQLGDFQRGSRNGLAVLPCQVIPSRQNQLNFLAQQQFRYEPCDQSVNARPPSNMQNSIRLHFAAWSAIYAEGNVAFATLLRYQHVVASTGQS